MADDITHWGGRTIFGTKCSFLEPNASVSEQIALYVYRVRAVPCYPNMVNVLGISKLHRSALDNDFQYQPVIVLSVPWSIEQPVLTVLRSVK